MNRPFVSVLIDTYNHERFIEEAVCSVLAQDFPADHREVIVVDDGSTDRTPDILARFRTNIRILRKKNGGQASAFNYGIPQCRGDIVTFLDGDDWWAPTKLTSVAAAFAAHPQVGLVGHSITEVLDGGIERSELVRDDPQFRIDSVRNAKLFRLRKNFLGTSRMAFRTELLRKIGTTPEALVIEADEFLFTLGAVFSEVLLLREPLTYYRLQGQNLFQNTYNSSSTRRKHAVLVALAKSLRTRFELERVPQEIVRTVVDAVEIEADALHLALGHGSPWQNFHTELRAYSLHHENASLLRRFLKFVSAIPALFLPVRTYSSLKRSLSSNNAYVTLRERFLPFHHAGHVDRTDNWKARR